MGKLGCPCGYTISDVTFPSPWCGDLIPAQTSDTYLASTGQDEAESLLREPGVINVWECTKCGRLATIKHGQPARWYIPEGDERTPLLRVYDPS